MGYEHVFLYITDFSAPVILPTVHAIDGVILMNHFIEGAPVTAAPFYFLRFDAATLLPAWSNSIVSNAVPIYDFTVQYSPFQLIYEGNGQTISRLGTVSCFDKNGSQFTPTSLALWLRLEYRD